MKLAEPPKPMRWTRDEYYKMADLGLFDGRRVHLIKGEVFEMSPQHGLHATAVTLADDVMRLIFKRGYKGEGRAPCRAALAGQGGGLAAVGREFPLRPPSGEVRHR